MMVSWICTWGTYIIEFTLALSYQLVKDGLWSTNFMMMLVMSLRIRMIAALGSLMIALSKLSCS